MHQYSILGKAGQYRPWRTMPKSIGRPTKLEPEVVKKLTAAFANGFNVEQACDYADISKPTYYDWIKKYPEFSNDMSKAQRAIGQLARKVVTDNLNKGDLRAARYWLDRRDPDFSPKAELKHDINPIDEILKQFKLDATQTKKLKTEPPKE